MNKYEGAYLSPDLKWDTFKKLYDAIPDGGPSPVQLPRVLWEMMRDQKIYIQIGEGDFVFSIQPPEKGAAIITNGQ